MEQLAFETSELGVGALAWGPPDGPLALLLHGYPDTAWTWRHLGPRLGELGWRAVAPFARGYAPTDLAPDGDYEVGALALDAASAHRALGGDDRAVIVGHDWGAVAAYAVSSWRPELFERVVTLAIPPVGASLAASLRRRNPAEAFRQAAAFRYFVFQQVPGLAERVLPSHIERQWERWAPGYDASEDLAFVADALRGPGHRAAAMRYYRAFLQPWYRQSRHAEARSHLRATPRQPFLYIHGRADACVRLALVEETKFPADAEIHVVEGGHFAHLQSPGVVGDLIGRFLGEPR